MNNAVGVMNMVKRAARSPLLDRHRRSAALCLGADMTVRKGDLELAQRLLIQADVDDPWALALPTGR
jgi:hypothetical protein